IVELHDLLPQLLQCIIDITMVGSCKDIVKASDSTIHMMLDGLTEDLSGAEIVLALIRLGNNKIENEDADEEEGMKQVFESRLNGSDGVLHEVGRCVNELQIATGNVDTSELNKQKRALLNLVRDVENSH